MNTTVMLALVLALSTLVAVQAQSGGTFNEPPGQRREQTFRVLEYEDGTINQRFKGTMRYYCTFRGKWSEERHPRDFPKSPSFSAPIMISHSNGYRMWTGTEAATLGVEAIAEVRLILSSEVVLWDVVQMICCCVLTTSSRADRG